MAAFYGRKCAAIANSEHTIIDVGIAGLTHQTLGKPIAFWCDEELQRTHEWREGTCLYIYNYQCFHQFDFHHINCDKQ